MKRFMKYLLPVIIALASLVSCAKETLNPDSVIIADEVEKNQFDNWLDYNFTGPYNIDFKYRFEMNESDMNYYTVPADYRQSIILAHLVKYLCVDTYDEVAGIDFTRAYFPKMFFLIGEWEYRNNGTIILGTAEGGKKILLTGVNYLISYMSYGAEVLNEYYIKTIHHEFTHILNQTKPLPTDFQLVNGEGYVGDSWSEEPYDAEYLSRGFISAYAQHSDVEDFAETVSIYITNTPEFWESQLDEAGSGAELIMTKLDIAKNYYRNSWGFELDDLRNTILRRQDDVLNGKIDLESLEIK